MDMNNLTLITMAWELFEQGVPRINIAQHLGRHRETVGIWIDEIQCRGLKGFAEKYENAKKGERKCRQTDPAVKRLVWQIREREFDCCGQKIQHFLGKEYQIHLSVPKIYEILAEKYEIKSKWKKNKERGLIPVASKPREVIQMDSVDFGDIYAFTGIDIFTKEADILLAPSLTSGYGCKFLVRAMGRRFNNHARLIQTDGGSEFKEKFKKAIPGYCDRHRIARPYRKNEQSFIESFNRTVRKECLGWVKYKARELSDCQGMVESFLKRYHTHRPHMSLNMQTPEEFRRSAECRIFTEN